MEPPYIYKHSLTVNGHLVNAMTWSGNMRPYRGVVIDPESGAHAYTGGCKSKSSALDRAVALARTLTPNKPTP